MIDNTLTDGTEGLDNTEEVELIDAEESKTVQEVPSSTQAAPTTSGTNRPPPTTNPADLQDEFKSAHPRPFMSNRPLILYAYSETKEARINLEFFIAHGLHAAADFVFILNGPTDATSLIPVTDNVRYVQRQNDCYDLGAYAEVLVRDNLYKRYRKFIMLNASIRGPFVPYWAESCWSDMYLKKVTNHVKAINFLLTRNCRGEGLT
jgi:hypothetical protein